MIVERNLDYSREGFGVDALEVPTVPDWMDTVTMTNDGIYCSGALPDGHGIGCYRLFYGKYWVIWDDVEYSDSDIDYDVPVVGGYGAAAYATRAWAA